MIFGKLSEHWAMAMSPWRCRGTTAAGSGWTARPRPGHRGHGPQPPAAPRWRAPPGSGTCACWPGCNP